MRAEVEYECGKCIETFILSFFCLKPLSFSNGRNVCNARIDSLRVIAFEREAIICTLKYLKQVGTEPNTISLCALIKYKPLNRLNINP